MSPRVPLLEREESLARAEKLGLPAQLAELNVFRALLQHPKLAKPVADLLLSMLVGGELDARLRELVIMRLGWATGSDYEWTQHWRIARQMGIPDEDLLAVRDWRASQRLSEADRAVLAATDDTLEHGVIRPETWELCRKNVGGEAALIELVGAIGTWRLISSLLRSIDIPLEDGVESWPPDGRAGPG